jgi:lipid-binding SYLF domain-containing protein
MKIGQAKMQAILAACTIACMGLSVQGFQTPSQAATAAEINTWSHEVITDFRAKVPEANKVLTEAKGLLIFPHLYKAGLVVGGKYSVGELLINNVVNGYYNMIGLSWGWQIGGQRQALLIAFMTDDALKKFQNSEGWDIGGDATVAIVKAGAQGGVDLSKLNKPVLVFALDQKGLMAGLSLQGSKISKVTKK